MEVLRDRIPKGGKYFLDGVLKVDKSINHQMDPNLMKQICAEFIRHYAPTGVNKIITIEASGVAPAIVMGLSLDPPVALVKKRKPLTIYDMLSTTVPSFTRQREYHVVTSKEYLNRGDRVLFVDDFLVYGNVARGIIDLRKRVGTELVGMGFIIEKAFQHGHDATEAAGVRCESLAIIESLDNYEIKVREI